MQDVPSPPPYGGILHVRGKAENISHLPGGQIFHLALPNFTSPKAKYHSRVARISLRPTGAAPFGRGVKERKPPAKGRFYSFQTVGRGAACLKRKENFDLCGGRLKALP